MKLGNPDYHGHYPGDPDEKDCKICNPGKRYIGDKPVVTRSQDYELDPPTWYDQDNAANSPLEADWDDLHQDAYGKLYEDIN